VVIFLTHRIAVTDDLHLKTIRQFCMNVECRKI